MNIFEIDGYVVCVGEWVVSASGPNGSFHNSNVDYYRDERGYDCGDDDEAVARVFAKNCREWDAPVAVIDEEFLSDFD